METTVGVQSATRDKLSRLKRKLGVVSMDEAIAHLLEERAELVTRRASDALLRAVAEKRPALAALCAKHGITRLAVFGSALHGDARPDSDLDLLVEFAADRIPGLIRFEGMAGEFSELLGQRVDLNTAGFLSPYFRDQVLAEAQDIHVVT